MKFTFMAHFQKEAHIWLAGWLTFFVIVYYTTVVGLSLFSFVVVIVLIGLTIERTFRAFQYVIFIYKELYACALLMIDDLTQNWKFVCVHWSLSVRLRCWFNKIIDLHIFYGIRINMNVYLSIWMMTRYAIMAWKTNNSMSKISSGITMIERCVCM